MQAEAGHLTMTGEPDGPPTRYGLSIVDLMTGLAAAFGLLAGVVKARETGVGMDVDTSLFDVAMHNLNYPGTWYLNGGTVTGRTARSGHPSLVPSQLYRTQDGWLFIMCNKEKFWPLLANELGHPEWIVDPELAVFAQRLKHRDRVTRLLDDALMQAPTATWIERLSGKVPVAPVFDIAQALENPFVHERDGVLDFEYGDGRAARMIANPIRIDGVDPAARAPRREWASTTTSCCARPASTPPRSRACASSASSLAARARPRRRARRRPRRRPRRLSGGRELRIARPQLDVAASRATAATLPLTLLMQAAASAATIAPAVAAPALLLRLGVGPAAVGLYVAAIYLAAMLSSQFGAALVKRWGPIRTSQVALRCAPPASPCSASPNLAAALAGALLVGAGYGPITPASSEILARTTPPERYALVFSIKQTGVPVGGVVAGLAVPALTNTLGPAQALLAVAALCLVAAASGEWLRASLDRGRDPAAPMPHSFASSHRCASSPPTRCSSSSPRARSCSRRCRSASPRTRSPS